MNVYFGTIPHGEQRYPTAGDWLWEKDHLTVFVSETGNDDYNLLLMVHELVEAYLCKKNGVDEKAVTAFDMEFEKNRPEWDEEEPGNDPDAPYHHEHMLASDIENYLAAVMQVDWRAYEKAVNDLCKTKTTAPKES